MKIVAVNVIDIVKPWNTYFNSNFWQIPIVSGALNAITMVDKMRISCASQ
jgi:hypothetical protein